MSIDVGLVEISTYEPVLHASVPRPHATQSEIDCASAPRVQQSNQRLQTKHAAAFAT